MGRAVALWLSRPSTRPAHKPALSTQLARQIPERKIEGMGGSRNAAVISEQPGDVLAQKRPRFFKAGKAKPKARCAVCCGQAHDSKMHVNAVNVQARIIARLARSSPN